MVRSVFSHTMVKSQRVLNRIEHKLVYFQIQFEILSRIPNNIAEKEDILALLFTNMQEMVHCARRYRSHVEIDTTVMPAKSESDVVFCLQLLCKIVHST